MILILNKLEAVCGILSNSMPNTCKYYNDFLTENLTDYRLTYEFTAPTDHETAALLKNETKFVIRGLDGEFLLFKIKDTKGSVGETNEIYVYAEAAGLELLNTVCRPATLTGVTPKQALAYLLAGTGWQSGTVQMQRTANLTFSDYTTSLEQMPTYAQAFGAELKYRITMKNGRVDKRLVDTLTRRGADNGKRFTYKKDLVGLTRSINTKNIFTALIGVGPANDDGIPMTFYDIEKLEYNKPFNQDFVADEKALQEYGDNGRHLMGFYKDDSASNKMELLINTYNKLQEVKNPVITYDANVILLGELLGRDWEKVRLGDTVGIYDVRLPTPVMIDARIQELKISFTNPQNSTATLSDYVPAKSNITKAMIKIKNNLDKTSGVLEGTKKTAEEVKGKVSSVSQDSGVHKDAKPPEFTRNSVLTYKGTTYAINEPVYDYGGLLVDPEAGEKLTIYTNKVLYADEGTIEFTLTPLKMVDYNNYLRMEYSPSARFLLYTNAAGRIAFSIDNWSAGYVRTEEGVLKLNKPVNIAVRWSDKSKTYTLFVNGELIGTALYKKATFGEFPTTMNVVHNYKSVISDLRISKVARSDYELEKRGKVNG